MVEERGVHRVLVEKPEGKSQWGYADIDGRIILSSSGSWRGGVGWVELAQNRDKWRALVSTIMNFQVSQK
jgi:hypothetical protein